MRKRKLLRILAGLTAFFLIGGMLFVVNSFIGNPISSMIAKKAIQNHVEQNYSFLDLEVEKPVYNFKYGAYMARAKSPTSVDTHFAVYYRNSKDIWDDYEGYVLDLFNTVQRLSEEYSAIAKSIISRELGYEDNRTMVLYSKDESEKYRDVLELDMKFSKDIPLESEVMLRLDVQGDSLEVAAQIIEDAHRAFIKNHCHFNKYSYYTENSEGTLIMINNVTPEVIEGGKLLDLLKEAEKQEDGVAGGLSVFIKQP